MQGQALTSLAISLHLWVGLGLSGYARSGLDFAGNISSLMGGAPTQRLCKVRT